MQIQDAPIIAGLIALAMAVVRFAEIAIRSAWNRRNGIAHPPSRVEEILDRQLETLRGMEKELASIHFDLRASSREQAHLQRSVDKVHDRLDKITVSRGAVSG